MSYAPPLASRRDSLRAGVPVLLALLALTLLATAGREARRPWSRYQPPVHEAGQVGPLRRSGGALAQWRAWEYDSGIEPAVLGAWTAEQLAATGWVRRTAADAASDQEWQRPEMELLVRISRAGGRSRVRLLVTPR